MAYAMVMVGGIIAMAVNVFAQSGGGGDGLPDWAQYGILGLLVLGFILRQIVPGTTWREERDRANAYEKEAKETFLPTLISATATMENTAKLLTEFKAERDTQIKSLSETLDKSIKVIEQFGKVAVSSAKTKSKRATPQTRKRV